MKSIVILFFIISSICFFFLYFVKSPGNIESKNLTRIFIFFIFIFIFIYLYCIILYYIRDDTILLLIFEFQDIYYASQDIYFIEYKIIKYKIFHINYFYILYNDYHKFEFFIELIRFCI